MKDKLNIPYPILVEGAYDKLRLECVVNARIIKTDGFGIFQNQEKRQLLKTLAQKSKIIVLTDSDGAGKLIRSHITGILPKEAVIPLYVPQIPGKEKRKATPSAEGFLGVEGMEQELLYNLFLPFSKDENIHVGEITKADLFEAGLTGEGSREKRAELSQKLGLPNDMSPNAFLSALNVLFSREEFLKTIYG